jgi:hypothetical protein
VRRFASLVLVTLTALAAVPATASALSVSIRDTYERGVLIRATLGVRVSGSPKARVKLTGAALIAGKKRPRAIRFTKPNTIGTGARGQREWSLPIVDASRPRLRAALAHCRNLRIRVRARTSARHAQTIRAIRPGHNCRSPRPRIDPPRGAKAARFQVGAASVGFTPPLHGQVPNDASDCTAPPNYDGPRKWAFMEPYQDADHTDPPDPLDPGPPETIPKNGHYDYGELYMDCNGNERWDGNFIGGGSDAPRYYDTAADAPSSRAVVVSNGKRTLAIEVTDQEGLFNVYQERIRQKVIADLGGASSPLKDQDMFLSATHDESAPQTLGLDGARDTVSATNDYFLDYFVNQSAGAIEQAYANRRAASIRYAQAYEPRNFRQCWSSYPYVDDPAMPIMQAVGGDGKVIATLANVSQHTETLGFNPDPAQKLWLSGDWPHFFRGSLEQRYGGVAIEMAGSVGSVESPEVFPDPISAIPQKYVDEDHPAGCRTLFTAAGEHVPLGYNGETKAFGLQLATAVAHAIDGGSSPSTSSALSGTRRDICVPFSNKLFALAAAVGVFAHRPGYTDNCTTEVTPAPNGSTSGNEAKSQVAAFRIGDGSFISVPGEVFPFTYLRGFLGPRDLPYPGEGLPPWLLTHMHTRYRFVDGLGEDMLGYIFPSGNGVGVPGERDPSDIDPSEDDRFGCHHSDDGEAASSQTGNIVGFALVKLLDAGGTKPERVRYGRYVMPGGSLSRDPLGSPVVKCDVDKTYHRKGPAIAFEGQDGAVVRPALWMDLHGRPQPRPTRTTRGYFRPDGKRVWADVFADVRVP